MPNAAGSAKTRSAAHAKKGYPEVSLVKWTRNITRIRGTGWTATNGIERYDTCSCSNARQTRTGGEISRIDWKGTNAHSRKEYLSIDKCDTITRNMMCIKVAKKKPNNAKPYERPASDSDKNNPEILPTPCLFPNATHILPNGNLTLLFSILLLFRPIVIFGLQWSNRDWV